MGTEAGRKRLLATFPKVTAEQDAIHEAQFQKMMRGLRERPVELRMRSEPKLKQSAVPREENPQGSLPGFGKVAGT